MATTTTPSKASGGSRRARRPGPSPGLRRPTTPTPAARSTPAAVSAARATPTPPRSAPLKSAAPAPTPTPALPGASAPADAIPVEARLKRIEARLAALELKRPAAGGADLDALSRRLIEQAVGPVLKAIDERVARLALSDAAQAQVQAQVGAFLAARAASGEDGLYRHERFVALAREVKALKDAVERPMANHSLRALLNSDDLKRALDERIRCLKDYIVEEVVPRALKSR